jgi:hypothetical protein
MGKVYRNSNHLHHKWERVAMEQDQLAQEHLFALERQPELLPRLRSLRSPNYISSLWGIIAMDDAPQT